MLIAQNFLPMVIKNLRIISRIDTPLHEVNPSNSSTIQVANEKAYYRNLVRAKFPYVMIMMLQLVFYWQKFPLAIMIQTVIFSVTYTNGILIAWEHYQKRYDLANLLNAFVDFEKRHNRKFHVVPNLLNLFWLKTLKNKK